MKIITRAALALGLAASLTAGALQDQAHARRGHGVGVGIAAGIIGLGILGAYSSRAYAGPACYRGPEQCGWAGRRCWENRYGETVCRGGEWRCYRRNYCD